MMSEAFPGALMWTYILAKAVFMDAQSGFVDSVPAAR